MSPGGRDDGAPLRVGIINIMPRAENYEPYLLRPLSLSGAAVDVIWIRLESHAYSSSDHDYILGNYRTYDRAISERPLEGLILTGAPVEELAFHEVTYWGELRQILGHASANIPSTLGLCWGGMALAKQLGIDKRAFSRKLSGVFQNRILSPGHGLLSRTGDSFWCAHSRHSGIDDSTLEQARDAGLLRLLSHAPETGYSIFETANHRHVMHLGHPEYEPSRLMEEWRRDLEVGRRDVDAPRNVDAPTPLASWRSHRAGLFSQWLSVLRTEAGGVHHLPDQEAGAPRRHVNLDGPAQPSE